MFGLFKKKSEKEKLMAQQEQMLKEAYDLSKIDRTKSDAKTAEAEELWQKIETME